MNIAMVFAGGVGQRMNTKTMPKQFLELHQKPIIIYTLEQFDNHPEIDGIVISCLESWIPYLEKLVKKFSITKVKAIVPGGDTGQDSIYNGINKAYELFPKDSIVLIHDAVRPIINEELITNNIATVKKYGNAITVSQAIETIVLKDNELSHVGKILSRDECLLAKAPQCFYLKDIYKAHEKARSENLEFIDSASMMQFYGTELFTVIGPAENIKITTPVDFYTFRAIIDAKENSQIFG